MTAHTILPDSKLQESLRALGVVMGEGLQVHTPISGELIGEIATDSTAALSKKIRHAQQAHEQWKTIAPEQREAFLLHYATFLKTHAEALTRIIVFEAGKTFPEALGEVNGAANVIANTIKQVKAQGEAAFKRAPVGVVGLITSFNFPFAVAHWTLAPALLAGNAVLWKPSEKTPLVSLAAQTLFVRAVKEFNAQHGTSVPEALMQPVIGTRTIGEALVANETVTMISATGSVAMGKGIKATLAKRSTPSAKPVLELGGNNAAIISKHLTPEALETALASVFFSALASSGQRCTDTRRLIVHASHFSHALSWLKTHYQEVLESGLITSPLELAEGKDGFGPLIDADAYARYRQAIEASLADGAKVHAGEQTFTSMPSGNTLRLHEGRFPDAYYVKPVLVEIPSQREGGILHSETFAPVLYLLCYHHFNEAMELAFAPANSGLVQALYTQDEAEKAAFAKHCPAGHGVINSRTGTGTPAQGLGFGGCRDSGEGEILGLDPLRPFTQEDGKIYATIPTHDKPDMVNDGNITRRKYIIEHKDGSRTRIVDNSL